MNPNVGLIVNGNAVLDRATFASVIEAGLIASAAQQTTGQAIVALNLTNNSAFPNVDTRTYASIQILGFDASKFDVLVSSDSGGEGARDWYITDRAALVAEVQSVLADPNTLFMLDMQAPGGSEKARQRTLYYRKNDVVLPLSTKPYYQASDWVEMRGGFLFVFGGIFSLVGAPILTAELGAIAAGTTTAATAAPSTAAIASSVASSFSSIVGDPRISQGVKLATLAAGQLDSGSAASSVGGSNMNFDFDGFDFSSGESTEFFGDWQQNDYGFNTEVPSVLDPGAYDGWDTDPWTFDDGPVSDYYNSTPEVTTNDFGTIFDDSFGDVSIKTVVDGVGIANQVKTVVQKPSGGGTTGVQAGGKQAAVAKGSNDILGTFANVLSNVGAAARAVGGTASQVTTQQQRTYAGQLTPTGGAAPSMLASISPMVLIGGAALLAFLVLKKG